MLLSLRPNLSEAQLAPLREVARRLGAELCFLDERGLRWIGVLARRERAGMGPGIGACGRLRPG